jgi:galactose oxidase
VPVGQVFSPPYLFQQGGGRSSRPVIVKAPDQIPYGGHFELRVAGPADQIASVALLRSDHNTHSLTAGDRYVKLAFSEAGGAPGNLLVKAPNLPAQAVPGVYLLYVVNERGVPSMGKRVDIKN